MKLARSRQLALLCLSSLALTACSGGPEDSAKAFSEVLVGISDKPIDKVATGEIVAMQPKFRARAARLTKSLGTCTAVQTKTVMSEDTVAHVQVSLTCQNKKDAPLGCMVVRKYDSAWKVTSGNC